MASSLELVAHCVKSHRVPVTHKLTAKSHTLLVYDDVIMTALIQRLQPTEFPTLLKEIADPPEQLYLRGTYPDQDLTFLCVVGSRKYTLYGKEVCQKLIAGLRGYPICIVSGLALGIDSIAHEAALSAGLTAVAVPGSGLSDSVLYPRTNLRLAHRILKNGGSLLSEFPPDHFARPENFPQRNRIMAGLSHAVLIIESEERSGTLITARFAVEYNRDVLTVPGSIFASQSRGNHRLIRSGATPITSSEELLDAVGFETKNEMAQSIVPEDCTKDERRLLVLLETPKEKDALIHALGLTTPQIGALISLLEIKGLIKETAGLIIRI